jgi:hypothetical protein
VASRHGLPDWLSSPPVLCSLCSTFLASWLFLKHTEHSSLRNFTCLLESHVAVLASRLSEHPSEIALYLSRKLSLPLFCLLTFRVRVVCLLDVSVSPSNELVLHAPPSSTLLLVAVQLFLWLLHHNCFYPSTFSALFCFFCISFYRMP